MSGGVMSYQWVELGPEEFLEGGVLSEVVMSEEFCPFT